TGIERYVADYAAYYDACKRPGSPAMRQPSPTVILIPGVGMIAFGKNKSESRVTAEFYTCAIEVMRGAEAIGGYIALPQQEAFDIEYWALEEAKLQRMPKDKPLAGHVAMVVGAGSGIGRETAHRLVPEDAHIACVDLHKDAAAETADELLTITGPGIGVAGSGVSSCGPAIGLACDMTDRAAVRAALDDIVLAYGGIDDLIITAGMFASPGPDGTVPDEMWQKTFAVNVIGPAVAADEAAKIMHTQSAANRDLDGTMVITTSVNAVVAKKGSIAYDTSKTAANHLIRELAVTHAPHVRVNGVAPATVIEGSTMFPRERVIASLAKYNIEFEKSEATESLIEKLGRFYASRTLLKKSIRPKDQAEAIFQLVSPNLSRTTGQVIHVDAGLADAFLR
ncbi:MAG: SDR family NAD(P)-dependent oxidoreductase, partial [Planctomycetota bacterium]